MSSQKKEQKKLSKQLVEAQQAHEKLLDKVAVARAKFEKRTERLQALEVQIGELEQRLYSPDDSRMGQAPSNSSLRDAFLIYNPKAAADGKEEHQLKNLIGMLRAHGMHVEVGIKTSGKAVRTMTKDAVAQKQALIVVAGGDGTIEDVIPDLIGSNTTMAILPIGTMNNIARSLGIPLEIEAACALIGMGVTRKIDVGHVIADVRPDLEYFMETAGLGLSAIAVPMGQAAKSKAWGELPKALRRFFEVKPSPISIELDSGEILQAHSQLVTVSNAPLIGTNFMIAPDAKMDDGYLDLTIFNDMTKSDLLGFFMNPAGAQKDQRIKRYRVQHVKIHSQEAQPQASDKDPLPERRIMEITVVPQCLSVIVGNGTGLTIPVQAVPTMEKIKEGAKEEPNAPPETVLAQDVLPSKANGSGR